MITDILKTPNLLELPEDVFEDDDRSKNSESDLPLISDRDRKLVTHPYDLIIRSLKSNYRLGKWKYREIDYMNNRSPALLKFFDNLKEVGTLLSMSKLNVLTSIDCSWHSYTWT